MPDPALAASGALVGLRSGQGPSCLASGAAVHLGGGRFLTAAHVADGSVQRLRPGCAGVAANPVVLAGGAEVPARVMGAGRDRVDPVMGQRYLRGEDAALLQAIRPLPGLPAARLCGRDPAVGDAVLLATPARSLRTVISGLYREADAGFGAYAELPLDLLPGESGGAAFDRATGCLLGLVSHKDRDTDPVHTRIVPASVLARFAPPP